jgi:uncharacterized protein
VSVKIANDIIGTGWHFPVEIDERGGIRCAVGPDDIAQAVHLILDTPIGIRLMRPQFGSRLHELVFAPMNASTFATARHYVEEALGMWEPRIDVTNVTVTPRRFEGRTSNDLPLIADYMEIVIAYRIRASHDERSLVFPFYTIPLET